MPVSLGMTKTTWVNDSLLAGDDFITDAVTIAANQTLSRGQILGRVTATGECVAHNPAATDGSQNVYAILAEDVASGATPAAATAYVAGTFKDTGLIGYAANLRDALRALNIYVKKTA